MKKEAHAIVFRLYLNVGDIEETVYISDGKYENLPLTSDLRFPDTESIIPEYFTKEKIDEYKRKICEKIMNSENPFDIIVPFKVAKAIKEAGYPLPDILEYGIPFYASTNSKMYGIDEHERIYPIAKAKPTKLYRIGENYISNKKNFILAPNYLDVWLWL